MVLLKWKTNKSANQISYGMIKENNVMQKLLDNNDILMYSEKWG